MPADGSSPEIPKQRPSLQVSFYTQEDYELVLSMAESAGVTPEQWAATAVRQRMHDWLERDRIQGIVRSQHIPDTIAEMWKDQSGEGEEI